MAQPEGARGRVPLPVEGRDELLAPRLLRKVGPFALGPRPQVMHLRVQDLGAMRCSRRCRADEADAKDYDSVGGNVGHALQYQGTIGPEASARTYVSATVCAPPTGR